MNQLNEKQDHDTTNTRSDKRPFPGVSVKIIDRNESPISPIAHELLKAARSKDGAGPPTPPVEFMRSSRRTKPTELTAIFNAHANSIQPSISS
jgi:hypothetical protein